MTIYLDHCATTPLAPEAAAAMERVLTDFGNPSSIHGPGRVARAALEEARRRLGECLNTPATGLVLTGSGSEAANLAIKGVVLARAPRPTHLIVSAIEHDCVRHATRYLTQRFDWVKVTEIAPDPSGRLRPEAIEHALRPETCLISLMHANNETGVIQPVEAAAAIAHRHGALFHTDAVQSMGRLKLDVATLGCDLLSLAAHKFYGPKGIGLLYVRPGVALDPLVHGGTQEGGRRAGTENLAAAVGMATAAELAGTRLAETQARLGQLEKVFWETLRAAQLPVERNGSADDKLSGVLNIAVAGLAQDDLVVGLDLAGVAVSAGSACSSGVIEPSHVLQAMGLPAWQVHGGVRISFGRENTLEEAREAAHRLVQLAERLRTRTPTGEQRP